MTTEDQPVDPGDASEEDESTEEKTPEQIAAEEQAAKAKLIGLGIAALAVIATCVMCVSGSFGGGEEDADSSEMAEIMCQDFVADRLKSPSTAEFSDASTTLLGTSRYKVTGAVDAENGFGAMIRAHYVCQVRYDGDDLWTAESVNLLE